MRWELGGKYVGMGSQTGSADVPDSAKAILRRTIRQSRLSIGPTALAIAAQTLSEHILAAAPIQAARHIAAYVPVGSEPGSIHVLDALLARGCQVLLPIVENDGALEWSLYQGSDSLQQVNGLQEPTGPRLSVKALETVDVMLVPALAVDRNGNRLGRGKGCYDRALADAPVGIPKAALLHDGEFVTAVPIEAHDHPVSAVITPSLGWIDLANSECGDDHVIKNPPHWTKQGGLSQHS